MILHRITLRNVGVYGGEHQIVLTPPDNEHPVILIGALNGGGKTTLLGALQLALYGSRARGIERTRRGYQRYLRDLINRDSPDSEGAAVTVEFERRIEGRPVRYEVRRSWQVEGEEVQESIRVTRNGEPDALMAAHWDETIDAYLPARLAHLFFFDGEQIERMADEEAASELLATAFQSLLGLDLVGRLKDDLSVLERRKRLSVRTPEEQERIQLLEREQQQAQAILDRVRQDLSSLTDPTARRRAELARLQERFRSEGGELVAQRQALEAERASLVLAKDSVESQIRELAAGPAPLLIVGDLLTQLRKQVEAEKLAHRERIIAEAEEARDVEIMAELGAKLTLKACRTVAEALRANRPRRDHFQTEMVLNADDGLGHELDILMKQTLPGARSSLASLEAEWREAEHRIEAADRKLTKVPDADALASLQQQIVRMQSEAESTDERRKALEDQARIAEFNLRLSESALKKEQERSADQWEESEHDHRILERIPRIKETLDSFRTKVVARHIGALERAILESFLHLNRKPKLIGSLSIDPATFAILLRDGNERPLPFNLLSAGERQLLATSILWGLARVSGRPVPLVIDTPLGRLDSQHRSHVVQRYFPAASHQVILLSTDEEIVGRYHEMIRPVVGNHYLIETDSASKKLTISNQYFKQQ